MQELLATERRVTRLLLDELGYPAYELLARTRLEDIDSWPPYRTAPPEIATELEVLFYTICRYNEDHDKTVRQVVVMKKMWHTVQIESKHNG